MSMYKRGTVILDNDNTAYQLQEEGFWCPAGDEVPIYLKYIGEYRVIWEPGN